MPASLTIAVTIWPAAILTRTDWPGAAFASTLPSAEIVKPGPAATTRTVWPADTDAALHYLRTHFHCRRFILLGLCSGAHTAFHAGLQLQQYQLDDLILLNPLTFHWTEDSSLDTTQHFQDVAYYRGSVRTARSWLKLLRGQELIEPAQPHVEQRIGQRALGMFRPGRTATQILLHGRLVFGAGGGQQRFQPLGGCGGEH